jgi:thiosulfate/3-mercaptopyruvate sulfurtransferase
LALAYSLIDTKYMPTIYDGSWCEYGKNSKWKDQQKSAL